MKEDAFKSDREIVELDLSYVRSNKRTFFAASEQAMATALRIGSQLGEADREAFRKVVECIALYDSIVECL